MLRARALGLALAIAAAACATPRSFSRTVPAPPPLAIEGAPRDFDPAAHAAPDAPGAPRSVVLATRHVELPNGVGMIALERAGVPMVTVVLRIGLGTDDDPELARLAVHAWELSSYAAWYELGATMSHVVMPTFAALAAQGPADAMDALVRIFADTVKDPASIEKVGFAWERDGTRDAFAAAAVRSDVRADRALAERLGHADKPVEETLAAIDRLRPEDLTAYLRARLRPSSATLVVVGDRSPAAVFESVRAHFADWKERGAAPAPRPTPATPIPGDPSAIVLVHRPDERQALLAIGAALPEHETADQLRDAGALASVLAGGVTSRLNARLRLERGATYGLRGFLTRRAWGDVLHVRGAVDAKRTGEALAAIVVELDAARAKAPTVAELEAARAESFGATALSGLELASWLTSWPGSGESFDVWASATSTGRARDPERVRALAEQVLAPERRRVVIVGDARVLEPALRDAGFTNLLRR